ncbi:hypothetical protein ABZ484_04370 [Streptomyces sp. NPDC006393]|uniref:hypothetical protein n=1 Tax=Streptomyces sp. NPDC006393 TaxID=3156763 RepID=UPI003405B744
MRGQITVPIRTADLMTATGLSPKELPGTGMTVTADLTAVTDTGVDPREPRLADERLMESNLKNLLPPGANQPPASLDAAAHWAVSGAPSDTRVRTVSVPAAGALRPLRNSDVPELDEDEGSKQ